MTKLMQWLLGLSLYFGVWLALLNNYVNHTFSELWLDIIKFSPLIILLLFGVFSATIVLWRVYSFNDCPEAAIELQEQIKKAKEELKKKGLDIFSAT